jgi:hypothetical protein
MKKTSAAIAIALAAVIGGVTGYWFRGQVMLTRQQAASMEVSPHALTLAPPGYSDTPPPGAGGGPPSK